MPSLRRVVSVAFVGAVLFLAGCRADQASAPSAMSSDPSALAATRWHHYPSRQGSTLSSQHAAEQAAGGLAQCTRREPQLGAAIIGPGGGTLVVGNNMLIVPAGALSTPTLITGYVPPTNIASIHFEPEGLQFKKPAGLRLNGMGCDISSDQPSVLYLDDEGNVLERIDATYSPWWGTVAAPIWHFSVYAIGV